MSGVIRIEPTAAARRHEKHDHAEFLMEGGARIVFNDSRRFGFVEALDACGWQGYRAFTAMGPEPLEDGFSGLVLAQALSGRTGAIKTALLDQKIVAGIGNIYACEALYAAGIDPQRVAGGLNAGECVRLAGAIKSVLRAALEAGGSSLKDYRHADGKLGYFQMSFAVYDREGEACGACDCDMIGGRGVHRIVQGGRSTFYCSQKQR
jgi:formamidopyrimidine-DNA glycosylase